MCTHDKTKPDISNGPRRHPLHLNERFIFLLLGNTLFLTYLALKDVLSLSVSKIPTWPKKKVRRISPAVPIDTHIDKS